MAEFAPVVNLDRTRGFNNVGNVATAIHLHLQRENTKQTRYNEVVAFFLSNL